MKLSAAILFAAANAQRDGRVRDKDSGDAAAAYDSYNAGFGGDDAYGGFYDAFADAFGDVGNYGYEYDAATAAPAVEDAGRPVETVEEEQDEGKTLEVDAVANAADPHHGDFNQHCFVGVGTDTTTWGNAGSWQQCKGEYQACEIKVVRRFNKSSSTNPITQIQSKCANEASCVDNMKQNFSPATADQTTHYSMWYAQSCRPMTLAGLSHASVGNRFKVLDSTCFFCVEPCTDADVVAGSAADVAALEDAKCIGKSGAHFNSLPDKAGAATLDIFDEAGLDQATIINAAGTGTDARDLKTNNYYSTVVVNINGPQGQFNREISKIQQRQLESTNADQVGASTISK